MKNLIAIVTLLVGLIFSGCASVDNYQFGDLSRTYCATTSPILRTQIKAELNAKGMNIGVDYCQLVGLVDKAVSNG